MNGLILDNYYKTISSMKFFAPVIFIASVFFLTTGNYTILEIFVCISITILSIPAVSSMRKDSEVNWNRYELTLPVTRKEIIQCKYICYLSWVAVGTIIAMLVTALGFLIHNNIFFILQDIVTLFSLGIGISLMVGTLFFPMIYLFGSDKSEVILAISVLGGIGLIVFFIWLLNVVAPVEYPSTTQFFLRISIFIIMCLLALMLSYLGTYKIFKQKEY